MNVVDATGENLDDRAMKLSPPRQSMASVPSVRVIAHRGLWRERSSQNSEAAFRAAYAAGAGVETDIRDRAGELVIAHDMPSQHNETVRDFFESYKLHGKGATLALNIKCDGMQDALEALLMDYQLTSYFVFDMSVPDLLGYRKKRLKYYTRESEYEPVPAAYGEAEGVWLDQFESNWIDAAAINRHHVAGKHICIVSPELHGRSYRAAWAVYKHAGARISGTHTYLCTDHVEEAIEFFRP